MKRSLRIYLENQWWILQLRSKTSSVQNDTMDGWKWIKEHSVLWDWSTSQKIQIFPSTLIAHPVILREAKLSRRIYWITNYKFFAKWNGIAESNCHTAWNEMESQNLLKNRWWILQLRAKMSSVQNDTMDGWKWIKEHSVLWDWSTSQKIQIFLRTLFAHPVILRTVKWSPRN